jgi:hypothetical protein
MECDCEIWTRDFGSLVGECRCVKRNWRRKDYNIQDCTSARLKGLFACAVFPYISLKKPTANYMLTKDLVLADC